MAVGVVQNANIGAGCPPINPEGVRSNSDPSVAQEIKPSPLNEAPQRKRVGVIKRLFQRRSKEG